MQKTLNYNNMQNQTEQQRQPLYTDKTISDGKGKKVIKVQRTLTHSEYRCTLMGMKTYEIQREFESTSSLSMVTSNGAHTFWHNRTKMVHTEMIRRGLNPIN